MSLQYIKSPRYGDLFGGWRGTGMCVVLGQDAGESYFRGGKFGDVMARAGFNTRYWIAGHMLNEDLGGYGESKNFVPLTQSANNNHSTYENRIKNSYLSAVQRMDSYDNDFWYGIYYRVTASAETFFNGPFYRNNLYCWVPSYITLRIEPVKVLKEEVLRGNEAQIQLYCLSDEERISFRTLANGYGSTDALPMSVEIHNTEYGAAIVGDRDDCIRNLQLGIASLFSHYNGQ